MKITNVRAIQPVAPESPPDWRTSMGQILVAIDTDAGLTGYGVGGGGIAGLHVVKAILRDLLIGKDPDHIESHWQAMYHATLPFGRKGLAIMAISGVDLALWDLRGKAANQPVCELLGGKTGEALPTYITVWDDISPEQAETFSAFKLHVGKQPPEQAGENVAHIVNRARATIGDDAELMIDAWMLWDLETTLNVEQACRSAKLSWIEEPMPVDDFAAYETLQRQTQTPIAGGEHEFTSAAFRELIDRKLHTVLQPDVCWCGGLTELVRIYEMANAAGVRVCPHRGAELWSLHAIAALDPNPLAESGRPWMTWVHGQPAIDNGKIALSDAPGLGVTIDEPNLPGVVE
ncbi:MAG: L-lyxonate dehydratase [Planctomycetaceae bacterium]